MAPRVAQTAVDHSLQRHVHPSERTADPEAAADTMLFVRGNGGQSLLRRGNQFERSRRLAVGTSCGDSCSSNSLRPCLQKEIEFLRCRIPASHLLQSLQERDRDEHAGARLGSRVSPPSTLENG